MFQYFTLRPQLQQLRKELIKSLCVHRASFTQLHETLVVTRGNRVTLHETLVVTRENRVTLHETLVFTRENRVTLRQTLFCAKNSYGLLWIPMDSYGIPMNSYGSLWIPMQQLACHSWTLHCLQSICTCLSAA
jgi:hypothetical protein